MLNLNKTIYLLYKNNEMIRFLLECIFSSLQSTIVEASLQLPQSLFSLAAVPGQAEDTVYKLHLLGLRNGKFFPSTSNSSQLADGGKRRSVATPVIMAKIGKS